MSKRYRVFTDPTRPAPRGVQAIVQESDRVGWHVVSHSDFYYWDGNEWIGVDAAGLIMHLKQDGLIRPTVGTIHEVLDNGEWTAVNEPGYQEWLDTLPQVLKGETISNDRFGEIFQAALSDADFGRKYGYLSDEVKPPGVMDVKR